MEDEPKSFLTQLRDAGAEYLQAKVQLTKVQAFEKIARVTGIVFSLLIVVLLSCFTVVFIGLMLGFLIADLTHSNAIGFSVIAGIFILLLIILVVKRESILEKPIAEKVVKELFEEENEKEGDSMMASPASSDDPEKMKDHEN